MTQFDAKQWIQDQLDEKGYSAPNTDLRRIETGILLDGHKKVRKMVSPETLGIWSISEEIAQAMTEWDKRYFIFRIAADDAFLRWNGKRCKQHGNDGFRADENGRVIHDEPCNLCFN